ncbi:enoyl-CoA hydratase/isomerase family protein [Mariniluteicoccus flavus]
MPETNQPKTNQRETVLLEAVGQVARVTINRPDSLNAIDPETNLLLQETLRRADLDTETWAIVLTGAGRAFCAGGDVKGMQGKSVYGRADRVLSIGRDLIDTLMRLEKPIIAAVNGPAVGLGATIALFCDVVYMADTAKIGDRHVNVGLVAGDGGSAIWPLLVGASRAKELLMTGRLLSAADAERWGAVSRAVPAGELEAEVMALADELCALPPYAVRATKTSINKMLQIQAAQIMDLSLAYEHLSMKQEDHQEALRAFAEKRKGTYVGR